MTPPPSTPPPSTPPVAVANRPPPVRRRPRAGRLIAPLSRIVTVIGVLSLVAVLPWLAGGDSRRDPALTVLRARSAEQEATPEALAAIRRQLGLADDPLAVLGHWWSGALRGDFGLSWISGTPVLPGTLTAVGISLTLMVGAMLVAVVTASLLVLPVLPVLRAGLRGSTGRSAGAGSAAITALPEFLLAAVLLLVGAVWLGLFPPYGWSTPSHLVLPALALGLPAGGLLGRLVGDAVTDAFAEPWVLTWTTAGLPGRSVVGGVLRRALPGLLPQVGLIMVGLTGGAVAVEQVYAIPGIGRTTLGAARAQDLPALQIGVLVLLGLGVLAGVAGQLGRRWMLGPALRLGTVSEPREQVGARRRARWVPLGAAGLLLAVFLAGIGRDPLASVHPRLAAPDLSRPFGSDASGRDVLARVAHGTLSTIALALAVTLLCFALGLLAGLLPRLCGGPIEVTNAAPPVIAGILVAALAGPSAAGAAVAIALVGWAPLAAHTAALVEQARARPSVAILPVLGVGRTRILFGAVLPVVWAPVLRHAMLRLPGIALGLAALGFLGLGPAPPRPDWGLLLAEGMNYVERAPWAVLAPLAALIAVAVLAVSLSSVGRTPRARVCSHALHQ